MSRRTSNAEQNNNTLVFDEEHGRTIFCSEAFEQILGRYVNNSFTFRIQNGIVQHAQHEANVSTFSLYWEDSQKFYKPIIVSLHHADTFRPGLSRIFSEKNLPKFISSHCNYKVNTSEHIYRLDVHQRVHNGGQVYEDLLLMSMWFTRDGGMGELSHLAAGKNMPANESLRIYNYFSKFLQIKNTLICDDAVLKNPDGHDIPIRVISAIATGKTWFERRIPGLTLFNCNNIPIGDYNTVSQSGAAREKSLHELQALTLKQWSEMLNGEQQKQLYDMYQKHFSQNTYAKKSMKNLFQANKEDNLQAGFATETLQALTRAIYHDSNSQKKLTKDLLCLSELLCGNIGLDFGNVPLNKKARDHWVKSRVKDLMWGGYIWKHRNKDNAEQSKEQLFTTGSFRL